ncbi:MAG: LamG-like jellyroll fold domain-containing protein, partial [Planctomycetota bacterium]
MKRLACVLLAAAARLFLAGDSTARVEDFVYLPPGIAGRVVFYHSFEKGVQQPEINLLGAKVNAVELPAAKGLTGNGYQTGSGPAGKKGAFRLQSAALSAHKPLTVMFWWRLDEPMKEETCFNIFALSGNKGYISNFVRGKGEWCGLKEPTYCFQVYSFAGMENWNDVWGGRVWVEPQVWHHTALVVSGAAEIRIYWDGSLRTLYAPKGRAFRAEDTDRLELGASGNQPPMTLDEVLVLDRALSADEIQRYVVAVRSLAERGFPVAK